jgi:alpha-glucosidase
MNYIIFCLRLTLSFFFISIAGFTQTFSYPNSPLRLDLDSKNGVPTYTVYWNNDLFLTGKIQVKTEKGKLINSLKIAEAQSSIKVESYNVVVGSKKRVNREFEEILVPFKSNLTNNGKIIFRLYKDAFTYTVKADLEKALRIKTEVFEFKLEDVNKLLLYGFDRGDKGDKRFVHSYEHNYLPFKYTDLKNNSLLPLPVAFKSEDFFGLITEAQVIKYPHSYLIPKKEGGFTSVAPVYPGTDYYTKPLERLELPWRVFLVSNNQLNLLDNDLIHSLNSPSEIKNPNWIQSGKAIWDWWNDYNVNVPNPGMNQVTMKQYLEFACQNDLEYMLIDAFWYGDEKDTNLSVIEPVPDIDIHELIATADNCGIGIHVWVNWNNMSKQYKKALKTYSEWGIKGIKMDFMARDDAQMVELVEKIVSEAAKYKLLVNLHGVFKPTGISRTYPNLITSEAVLGNEYYKWNNFAGPEHAVTIPFIRGAIGPLDFTPAGFDNVDSNEFDARLHNPMVVGTRAHQLAMMVVYSSPFQTLADDPSSLSDGLGLDWLRAVPTSWDETIPLSGEIGEFVVVARRKGDKWYIGGMTDWKERKIRISLDFMKNKTYQITTWSDGNDGPRSVVKKKEVIERGEELVMSLKPGGGFVQILIPKT